jgi:hypothetical protein
MTNQVYLSDEQIQVMAPSAFAGQPYQKQSDRYAFVPTIAVIDGMRNAGFFPVKAVQSRTRVEGKQMFTKHLIRFRSSDQQAITVGDSLVETVLINSHDGTSAYDLSLGVFRLVCSNGMVVGDVFESVHIRHIGNIIERVIEASLEMLKNAPKIAESVNLWRTITLAPQEQLYLAEAAHSLRFEEGSNLALAVTPDKLLTVRRNSDAGSDLWSTFNRVQENVIRGGIRGNRIAGINRQRSRAVKGIDQDTKLNKALWTLAEKMATLKA